MNAHVFFDFALQNQKKHGHSFKIFLGGVSRQGSFETASRGATPRPFRKDKQHRLNTPWFWAFIFQKSLGCMKKGC
jgi:hypothetical protein